MTQSYLDRILKAQKNSPSEATPDLSEGVDAALEQMKALAALNPTLEIIEPPEEHDEDHTEDIRGDLELAPSSAVEATTAVQIVEAELPMVSPPVPLTHLYWRLSDWAKEYVAADDRAVLILDTEEAILSKRLSGIDIMAIDDEYGVDFALYHDEQAEAFQREMRLKYGKIPTWEQVINGEVDFWKSVQHKRELAQLEPA